MIVKVRAVQRTYPGGWAAFRDAAPNSTLCSDNEITSLGFMSPADVESFVSSLERNGLAFIADGQAQEIAVVDQRRGFSMPCSWAEFGRIDLDGDPRKQIAACRLVGSTERLFTPAGWTFENSLSSQYLFVGTGWVPEFMDFVRHEQGLDVYRDLRTGKEVYVGRSNA
ncbi:MAG: hypothetical protein HZA52_03080 [Planctomycetes bacterium]|nr:hypothetical protein [Planctomycetota bacterium]